MLLQYSGIVKQEEVEAWIRDLAAIYPVEVVDCRVSRNGSVVWGCEDPERILIRTRLISSGAILESAIP